MNRRLGRGGDDRGATLVEFALIAPLLFFLMGAMLNIGLAVLGGSVASNGAREGARTGILAYDKADDPTSANYAAIKAAVDSKLVKLINPDTSSGVYVQVKCLSGDDPTVQIACTTAAVQVDWDLLEVTVKWKSISPVKGPLTASAYSNKARMVITGGGNAGTGGGGSGGTCATPAGAMSWAPSTTAVTEGNTGAVTDVVLTATRAGSTACTSTVGFSTVDGSATVADDDYEANSGLLTFLPGETSTQVTLSQIVNGDSKFESNESFTVVMTALTNVNGTIGTGTATVTVTNDDISGGAPQLVALKMFDTDSDGKVDKVTAQFDATLASYSAGNTPWTLANVPSGGSLKNNGVTVSGTTATLLLNEGGGVENTASGSFTVALAQNANGIRDGAGNKSSFPATAVQDWAGPVLLDVTDTDGTTDGMAQQGDTLTLTFSEAIAAATLPTTTNVQETAGATPMLSIPGVIVATALNPKNDYTNGCTLSFPASTVTSSAVDKTVTVTLATPTAGCTALAGQSTANAGMSFSPDSGLTDGVASGRNAAGPTVPAFNTGNKWHMF